MPSRTQLQSKHKDTIGGSTLLRHRIDGSDVIVIVARNLIAKKSFEMYYTILSRIENGDIERITLY